MRRTRRVFQLAACLVFSGMVLLSPDLPAESTAQAREQYRAKLAALDREQFDARLALALWCVDQGLLDEARQQLDVAAFIDPKSDKLLPAWSKLAEKMPRRKVTITLVYEDGSVMKGTCAPKPFILQRDSGVMLVPVTELQALELVAANRDGRVVKLQTPRGVFEGKLVADPIDIKTVLGEFKIPIEKIRRFSIGDAGEPIKDETPEKKPGDVTLNWDTHLADLKAHGLDVMLVFDATGSMGGIILEVKSRIREMARLMSSLVPNARIGLVAYRDKKKFDLDDYEFTVKHLPLTAADETGLARLQQFLKATEAYGGGDVPEAVYDGVQTAVTKAGWNAGAKKVIIVFGDAPPRPERLEHGRLLTLCRSWKSRGGILCCIDTTGGSKLLPDFKTMAELGGGESCFLNDQRAIIKQILIYVFGSKWKNEVDKAYSQLRGPR